MIFTVTRNHFLTFCCWFTVCDHITCIPKHKEYDSYLELAISLAAYRLGFNCIQCERYGPVLKEKKIA